ncbi:MAG: hypothetical protein ACN4GR_04575 [Arenicellales bacterium]
MNIALYFMMSYFAAGIVYITREADQLAACRQHPMPPINHPLRRISAGMLIMLLWPAFLLGEIFEPSRSPMAVWSDR